MHSHRRPRGRVLFEAVCALTVGVSFVGAWIQTGAWAFIAPAFVFTLFGLYWAIDLFGQDGATVVAEPVQAPILATARLAEPVPSPDARPEQREVPAATWPEPAAVHVEGPEHTDVAPFVAEPLVEPRPEPALAAVPRARTKKPRAAKKAPPPVIEQPPVLSEAEHHDQHIEQLFDPKPFARQARPAFGKRSSGPGPRPLPAA